MNFYINESDFQKFADFQPVDDTIVIGQMQNDAVCISKNHSLIEKDMKKFEVVISNRSSYIFDFIKGDLYMRYHGSNPKGVLKILLEKISSLKSLEIRTHSLKDSKKQKCVVFTTIKNGFEIAIFNSQKVYSHNIMAENRGICNMGIEELIQVCKSIVNKEPETLPINDIEKIEREIVYTQIPMSCTAEKPVYSNQTLSKDKNFKKLVERNHANRGLNRRERISRIKNALDRKHKTKSDSKIKHLENLLNQLE